MTLPAAALAALRPHVLEYVDPGPEALIFTGAKGATLRSSNFHGATKWVETVAKVGLPSGFHFHDLRHTGNTLAAASGASTRELMHRMGHGSMRAARSTSMRPASGTARSRRRWTSGSTAGAAPPAPKKRRRKKCGDGDDGPAGALVG